MPWIISAFVLSVVFILWGLIMAGTITALQFVGIPYILALPIASITPLIFLFLFVVIGDTLLSRERFYGND